MAAKALWRRAALQQDRLLVRGGSTFARDGERIPVSDVELPITGSIHWPIRRHCIAGPNPGRTSLTGRKGRGKNQGRKVKVYWPQSCCGMMTVAGLFYTVRFRSHH